MSEFYLCVLGLGREGVLCVHEAIIKRKELHMKGLLLSITNIWKKSGDIQIDAEQNKSLLSCLANIH